MCCFRTDFRFLCRAAGVFALVLPVLAVLSPAPLYAGTTPAAKPELARVESSLKQEEKRQKKLQQDGASIAKRLERLRGEMIRITRQVREQERALLALQKKQDKTAAEIAAAHRQLQASRDTLARLVTAVRRISRVPPQALLARPSAPVDMARSFSLLEQVIPAVSEQAAQVRTMLHDLETLRRTQQEQETALRHEQQQIGEKRAQLEKMVRQRETLLADNRKAQEKSRKESAALAQKAADLRELLARLETQEQDRAASGSASRSGKPAGKSESGALATARGKNLFRSLADWFGGAASLPVTGNVVTGYGDKMPGGGTSRGLRIEAASEALVTAPLDGVVRFAGPFRQYKLLVIIQHDNGDHSLLGGMQELYTETGARIAKGEPLGKLPKLEGDSTHASGLYYERRRNGKPIDPRRA